MLWHNENQQPFSWLGIDWGARGGITARELALWTTLQREYRARGLLPGEALSRFDAIGVQWDSAQASGAADVGRRGAYWSLGRCCSFDAADLRNPGVLVVLGWMGSVEQQVEGGIGS